MPLLTVTGYGEFNAEPNERLIIALERVGVDILHRCGGVARCTTCRVQFGAGEPERMTEAEHAKLTEKGLTGLRLSCQISCTQDMTLSPVQTVRSSGLEPGKAPQEQIEPEPVWVGKLLGGTQTPRS